jgi:hypothetical protein
MIQRRSSPAPERVAAFSREETIAPIEDSEMFLEECPLDRGFNSKIGVVREKAPSATWKQSSRGLPTAVDLGAR